MYVSLLLPPNFIRFFGIVLLFAPSVPPDKPLRRVNYFNPHESPVHTLMLMSPFWISDHFIPSHFS